MLITKRSDDMSEVKGKQSLRFAKTPFILNSASVVGKKEGEGPLGEYFDVIGNDDKFGCESWEEAESTLQKEAATLALGKSGLTPEEIRYIFAGDLLMLFVLLVLLLVKTRRKK